MLEAWIEHLSGSLEELETNLELERLDKIVELLGGDKNALKTNLVSERITIIVNLLTGDTKENATLDDLIEVFSERAKAEVTGTSITVNNSTSLPAGVEIIGDVVGKNLLNPCGNSIETNGLTFINNGDGTFSVRGTAIKHTGLPLTNLNRYPIKLIGGKTYTQTVIMLEGTFPTNCDVVPAVIDEEKVPVYNYFQGNQTKTVDKNYDIYSYTLYVQSGATIDTTFKVQFEEGKATEYEPYGTAYIKVCNKNLVDSSELEMGSFVGLEDNYAGEYEMNNRIRSGYILVKPNTNYTIQTFEDDLIIQYVCEYDENKKGSMAERPIKNADSTSFTFLTSNTTKYVRFNVRYANDTVMNLDILEKMQLEEGTTATNYVPHQEQHFELSAKTDYKMNIETYYPTTHIVSTGSAQPTIKLKYKKVIE